MMKTLFVTPTTVYPPKGGAPLRNWQHINILSELGPVAIFSVGAEVGAKLSLPQVSLWTHHALEPCSSRNRLRSLVNLTRPPRWWVYPFFNDLVSEKAIASLESTIDTFGPDVAILDRSQLYGYLPLLRRKSVPVIWDTHNVQSSLVAEMNSTLRGIGASILSSFALRRLRNLERSIAAQATQVWVCSDNDARKIERVCGNAKDIRVIPNAVDVSFYDVVRQCEIGQTSRNGPHLVFVGVLSYQPNRLAAEFLLEEVFPLVRSMLPDSRCTVVGRNPSQRMLDAMAKDSSICLPGSVDDVRPYLSEADIVVVPLTQGGGTRLKILEAFAAGRPVVSTSKGIEGLFASDGGHLLIADDRNAFAGTITRLWFDAKLRTSLTEAAYRLVCERYSWSAVGIALKDAVQHCLPAQAALRA